MAQHTHNRKGKVITEVSTGNATDHKSINQAKKASRKLQGSLGDGSIKVVAHKSQRVTRTLSEDEVARLRTGR